MSHTPISTFPLSPVGSTLGRPLMGPEIKLSGKHDGMCLYLSRLLCQLWDGPVAMETVDNKVHVYSIIIIDVHVHVLFVGIH